MKERGLEVERRVNPRFHLSNLVVSSEHLSVNVLILSDAGAGAGAPSQPAQAESERSQKQAECEQSQKQAESERSQKQAESERSQKQLTTNPAEPGEQSSAGEPEEKGALDQSTPCLITGDGTNNSSRNDLCAGGVLWLHTCSHSDWCRPCQELAFGSFS